MDRKEAEKLIEDLISPMIDMFNPKAKLELEPWNAIGRAHNALLDALTKPVQEWKDAPDGEGYYINLKLLIKMLIRFA
jgi:hypothetical protein